MCVSAGYMLYVYTYGTLSNRRDEHRPQNSQWCQITAFKGDSLCGCDVHVGGRQHVLKLIEVCHLLISSNISRQFISLLVFSRNSDTSITVLLRRHLLLFKKTAHAGRPGIMRRASFGNTSVTSQVLTPHSKHVSQRMWLL